MHWCLRYAAEAAGLRTGGLPGRAFTRVPGSAATPSRSTGRAACDSLGVRVEPKSPLSSHPSFPPAFPGDTGPVGKASAASIHQMAAASSLAFRQTFCIGLADLRGWKEDVTGIASGSSQEAGIQGRGHVRSVTCTSKRPSLVPWAHQGTTTSQQPLHRTRRLLSSTAIGISDAGARAISSDSGPAHALPHHPASARELPRVSTNVYLFHEDVLGALELSCYAVHDEPRLSNQLAYLAATGLRSKYKQHFVYDPMRHVIVSMSPRNQPLPDMLEVEVRRRVWKLVRMSPGEELAAQQPGLPGKGREHGGGRVAEAIGGPDLQGRLSTKVTAKLLTQDLWHVARATGKTIFVEPLPSGGEMVTELDLQATVVDGRPAVVADARSQGSLSLKELVDLGVDPVGITVKTHSGPRGAITAVAPLGGQESPVRKRLLELSRVEANREAIRQAPDDELVCTVAAGTDGRAYDWVASKLSVYNVPSEVTASNEQVEEAMQRVARTVKKRTRPNSRERKAMLDAFLKRMCAPGGSGLPGRGAMLVQVSSDAGLASDLGVQRLFGWADLHGQQRVYGGGVTVSVDDLLVSPKSRVFDVLKTNGIFKARALPKGSDALATLLAVGSQEEAQSAWDAALFFAEQVHQVLFNAGAVNDLLRGVASDMLLSADRMRETVWQLKCKGAGAVLCLSTYPPGSTQQVGLHSVFHQACRHFQVAPHFVSLDDICKGLGAWESLPLEDLKPRMADAVCSLCTGLGHVPWSLSTGLDFADHVLRIKTRLIFCQEKGWQHEVQMVVVPRGGELQVFKQTDDGAEFEEDCRRFLDGAVLEGMEEVAVVLEGQPRAELLVLYGFLTQRNARLTLVEVTKEHSFQVFGLGSEGPSHIEEDWSDLCITLGLREALLLPPGSPHPLLLRMKENELGLTLEQAKTLVSWTRGLYF